MFYWYNIVKLPDRFLTRTKELETQLQVGNHEPSDPDEQGELPNTAARRSIASEQLQELKIEMFDYAAKNKRTTGMGRTCTANLVRYDFLAGFSEFPYQSRKSLRTRSHRQVFHGPENISGIHIP